MVDRSAYDGARNGSTHEVTVDLAYKRLAIVNVMFYGLPGAGDRQWVLIDAGLPRTAELIAKAAAARFPSARPAAIVMTHGHFDHVGALKELADRWQVQVYAHPLELPYLDGRSSYPPPDPQVGGGLMARLSGFYPKGPIDVGGWLRPLPGDGSVPGMPGWRWLHTPGHTPGHVSLWREADRLLVAGDAFVTTKQESAYAVAVQKPEVHGPPRYYTQDWEAARTSAERIAALNPEAAVTGHGPALRGAELRAALHTLARDFTRLAVPEHGRYVGTPARADERGTVYVPPKPPKGSGGTPGVAATGIALTLVGGWLLYRGIRSEDRRPGAGDTNRARPGTPADAPEVERSITIGRPAGELYRRWREPETLSQVMGHAAEVRDAGEGRTHWRVHAPLGQSLEWETRVVEERPGELIRWESLAGAALANEGSVTFRPAPGDWGTEVTLHFRFDPPGGAAGTAAAKLMEAVPKTLVSKALRRFKSLVETGEVPTLEHNPSARGRGDAV